MIIKILCHHRTLHYWNLELIRAIDLCVSTRQLVEAKLCIPTEQIRRYATKIIYILE